jgi:hypothetical protein
MISLLGGLWSISVLYLTFSACQKTTVQAVVLLDSLKQQKTIKNRGSYSRTSIPYIRTDYHGKTTVWAAYLGTVFPEMSKTVILMESYGATEDLFDLKSKAGAYSLCRKINC